MIIVVADGMENEVIGELRSLGTVRYKPEDLKVALSDADVLVVRSATKVTKELISDAGKLRIVARAGVGLDNIDQDACKRKGIKVVNTPGTSTNAVAELAIGYIIGMFRNMQKAHHQMKNGIWDKKHLVGREIEGKTLGIIGYGRIGSAIGRKALCLGMKIISYNPPPRHEDGIITYIEDLDEFLPMCDVITLHVPLTDGTRHMIDAEAISKMKDGACIMNTARGGIIDEDALYDALKGGKLSAAALDVYEEEPYKGKLLGLDNIYFTPHLGASTKEAQLNIGRRLVELIIEA